MNKYSVEISRPRVTRIEVIANNEEEACLKAREHELLIGSFNLDWEDRRDEDVLTATKIGEPKVSKLRRMEDKLRSYGLFVEPQLDAEDNLYGYIVITDVDPMNYDVGFELKFEMNPEVDESITAEMFLDMWRKAVREFNPEATTWEYLNTLEDYEAKDLIRVSLQSFDDFKGYLRKTVNEMITFLKTLEDEEE